MDIRKYLYNETVGTIPKDASGKEIPALLFANSTNKAKFGDIYLFSNFGISGGNTVTASSEITNNYVENNSQIQDHWGITPITYTLTGYIGELIYKPANTWTSFIENKIGNFLAPITMISPVVSSYVQAAMNTVHQIEANYQKFSKYAENVLKNIDAIKGKNTVEISNAQRIYENLIALRNRRILVDVYTPFGEFKNMAMTNIQMKEEENSKYKCSISVTLQEYRDVETYIRQASDDEIKKLVRSEQLDEQASDIKNNGIATSNKTQLAEIVNPDNKLQAKFYQRN